jgi:hypothetical protein
MYAGIQRRGGQISVAGLLVAATVMLNKFRLAVQAFGTPQAYNDWVFATGLPDDIDLKLMYAGEGTLWTDMKNPNFGIRANYSVDPKPQSTSTEKITLRQH